MQKFVLMTAAALGGLSVMIGAFGAHALQTTLEAQGRIETFETAVKYQFYHTLALFLIGLLMFRLQDRLLDYAAYSMMGGILVFSGSLYILCLSGVRWLGAITPIGGLLFIVGWVLLLLSVAKSSL
uniref:DUF423 domain-containing protein n=1 Tax=Roseihalotalea indica TaxID=2867963 RepID=A0AA49GUD6_9BACT|nr:DUF423 domain-containing protein [Tunicatimonas sp. TK19036]